MAEDDWRAMYASLLKQIRAMQRQLARAEGEARVFRERARIEGEKFQSIRTERRARGRMSKPATAQEPLARRNRKKR